MRKNKFPFTKPLSVNIVQFNDRQPPKVVNLGQYDGVILERKSKGNEPKEDTILYGFYKKATASYELDQETGLSWFYTVNVDLHIQEVTKEMSEEGKAEYRKIVTAFVNSTDVTYR